MSDAVAILGAGGHGKVVLSTLQAAGHEVAGLFDRDPSLRGKSILGVEVVGSTDELRQLGLRRAILAVGCNRARQELERDLARLELEWTSVAHPAAVVHESVRTGAGSVVFAGAVVQPDTRIGNHAIVNTGASVDHDCALADYVHVAPGARLAGGVQVGEGALIGVGSAIIPGVTIGAWATVAAGATVVDDVPAGITVMGVPAR